ncbi:MAG: hypothetical protein NTV57_00525 [Cyanobacteria bacterium]|nr:hypothetical protein [Cyanobacteriota bacterium]
MRLEPLQAWFQPRPGPLLPQLRPALLARAQAQAGPGAQLLRWAITAAEAERGLRIEAVVLVGVLAEQPAGQRLEQPALDTQANGLPECGADSLQPPRLPGPGNKGSRPVAPAPTADRAATAASAP